ncbi:unnamed protein product [Victoria cruziana]
MGAKSSRGCLWWLIALAIAALVVAAAVFTIGHSRKKSRSGTLPVPGPPGALSEKYSEALGVALQFFDVQKSGKLQGNTIPWRGDSALKDGQAAGLDLSKGLYDAGDHVKFGLPMAFTATVLSWAILEYGDQMNAAKKLAPAQDAVKWITDYLINAHPKDNVLYIQVGDAKTDHACWERPEDMTEERPLTQVNTSSPGTEVAAETAAALASASLVFKATNPTYSDLLLRHAKKLFTFADSYRASYSISIPKVQQFYNSTGYEDELLWAAAWLYHATQDQSYLSYATVKNGESFAQWGDPSWFSWDNKLAGTQVLLSRVMFFASDKASDEDKSGLENYKKTAEAVICALLPDSPTATTDRTDGNQRSFT